MGSFTKRSVTEVVVVALLKFQKGDMSAGPPRHAEGK